MGIYNLFAILKKLILKQNNNSEIKAWRRACGGKECC